MPLTEQRHLQFLPSTTGDQGSWNRQASSTVNGLLRGGPHQLLWRRLEQPVLNMALGGTNDPTLSAFKTNLKAYKFAAGSLQEVFCTYTLNHDYARGTDIVPFLIWTTDASPTPSTGTVLWKMIYSYGQKEGGQFTAESTVTLSEAYGSAFLDYYMMLTEGAAFGSDLNLEPYTTINCRWYRDAADEADNNTDAQFLLTAGFKYQAERLGTANKAPDYYEP